MKTRLLIVLTLIGMITVSCSKDYFDEDKYVEIVTENFPVDNVDATHSWSCINECTADISIDIDRGKTYTIKVYGNDPMEGFTGYVLVQGQVKNGNKLVANFSYPTVSDNLYIAVVDENGTTYSCPVTVANGKVAANITANDLEKMQNTSRQIYDIGFDVAYCFEDSYPQPADFDFNDVVIGTNMIKNIGDTHTTITLNVSILAVGSTKMMAAALHIAGLNAASVKSVECSGDLFRYNEYGLGNFTDENDKQFFPTEQPQAGYLTTPSQNNDIYIPLTNDVHYSINRGTVTSTGMVERLYYNTMHSSYISKPTEDGTIVFTGKNIAYVTGTITITLNDGVGDRNITAKNLDMFVMEEYNSAIWEVHTFAYKTQPVIFTSDKYVKNVFPWALAVPGSSFRWPAEGVAIGSNKGSTVFDGAFQDLEHSFGMWAMDKNKAKDWYKYPQEDLVY